jgi:hypothetical protein
VDFRRDLTTLAVPVHLLADRSVAFMEQVRATLP